MICPSCKKHEFLVVRTITEGPVVIRYRACECGFRKKTIEDASDSNAGIKGDSQAHDARV